MRAAIFIDGGYLFKQMQDAKVTPDYSRLAEFFLAPLSRRIPLDLMRCYFYYCPPWISDKPTEDELRRKAGHERFLHEIQEACDRWQIRLGKLERRRDGEKDVFAQKRVDVQLSVDLVQHTAAGHIQHAVMVAGDSDFIPAIVAAKESGATVSLWCDHDRSVHRDLIFHADEVHFIDWQAFPSRKDDRAHAALAAQHGALNGEPRRRRRRRGGRGRGGVKPQTEVALGVATDAGFEPARVVSRAHPEEDTVNPVANADLVEASSFEGGAQPKGSESQPQESTVSRASEVNAPATLSATSEQVEGIDQSRTTAGKRENSAKAVHAPDSKLSSARPRTRQQAAATRPKKRPTQAMDLGPAEPKTENSHPSSSPAGPVTLLAENSETKADQPKRRRRSGQRRKRPASESPTPVH